MQYLCKQFGPRSGPIQLINAKNMVMILDQPGNSRGLERLTNVQRAREEKNLAASLPCPALSHPPSLPRIILQVYTGDWSQDLKQHICHLFLKDGNYPACKELLDQIQCCNYLPGI